jgi:hypothetical protein
MGAGNRYPALVTTGELCPRQEATKAGKRYKTDCILRARIRVVNPQGSVVVPQILESARASKRGGLK